MSARNIAQALGAARRHGTGWIARCPAPGHGRGRGDRNPSLSLRDDGDWVLVYCHSGCEQGDVIATLRDWGLLPCAETASPRRRGARDDRPRAPLVLDLWRQAVPAQGTPVERYLEVRGFTGPIPATLRYHPDLKHTSGSRHPAMIAAVARVPERAVTGVHRTYLAPGGTGKAKANPAKAMLGTVGGGAVRLAPAGEHLAIAEGIETALSIMQATSAPTWAALSVGGIKNLILPPLPLASVVTITADHDAVGLRAAHDAAERWTLEGRRVRIALPPEGRDFNDLLRGVVA